MIVVMFLVLKAAVVGWAGIRNQHGNAQDISKESGQR
jgi:hypothetical protein